MKPYTNKVLVKAVSDTKIIIEGSPNVKKLVVQAVGDNVERIKKGNVVYPDRADCFKGFNGEKHKDLYIMDKENIISYE